VKEIGVLLHERLHIAQVVRADGIDTLVTDGDLASVNIPKAHHQAAER